MKQTEYINGAFPFPLDPKGLDPCSNLSLQYQKAQFLMPVPKDKPRPLQQGFVRGSGEVRHLEMVSEVFSSAT